MVKQQH